MSSGGDFDMASTHRVEETKEFWKDVNNAYIVDSRDLFIKGAPEDQLVNWIESHNLNFQAVMVPPAEDFHFEHRIINFVGKALTRKKKISIIEYYTPSTSHTWVANVFVDIDKEYYLKKERLKVFKTQKTRKYFQEDCLDSFHINYFCNKRESGYVEQFKVDFIFV